MLDDAIMTKPSINIKIKSSSPVCIDTVNTNNFSTSTIDGMVRTRRETVASAAKTGSSNFSSINNTAVSNGAQLVTIEITHYEVFNANTGVTNLTYPISVKATKYHV